jgi:PHP family Zn ribbon phosphoesterase
MSKKEWLEQKIMCDEWGRPPSLADVPLTIMTRKEAFIKQGGDTKSINKLWKEVKESYNAKEEE